MLKKKLLDQEAKLKKELENTALELSQKEKHFNAKILEMAQANSAGRNWGHLSQPLHLPDGKLGT